MGMTSEDKIHALKLIKLKIEPPTDNRLGWLEIWIHKEDLEAFDSAIKALEQESILDKIRAEIENDWQLKKYPSSPFSCGLRRAIEIIDKYKAESEEE